MKKIKIHWPSLLAYPLAIVLVALFATVAMPQTLPVSYYTCDSTQISGGIFDNRGVNNMTIPSSSYQIITGGKVGKFLRLGAGANIAYPTQTTTSITGSFTAEWIFRGGMDFNTTDFIRKQNGAWSFKIDLPQNNNCTPQFEFMVNTGSSNTFIVNLDGADRKSIHYYLDGNWHHMAIQYNSSNGIRKVFVDGVCPAGFSDTISGSPITTSDNRIILNTVTSYRKFYGDLDEVALYNSAIAPAQVYQHYLNMLAGQHYSFSAYGGAIPTITVDLGYDTLDYAPGSVIPTPSTHTTGVTKTALTQLSSYPNPRYKKGNTLIRNYNWADLYYLGGLFQSGMTDDSVAKWGSAINLELATRWNYMLIVNPNSGSYTNQYVDTTKLVGKLVKQANANPSIPAGITSFWSQLYPPAIGLPNQGEYVNQKDLPDNYYLRDDGGRFLNISGVVTVIDNEKVLSPACPLDSIALDGKIQRLYLKTLMTTLTRPLDYISENDEVLPAWNETLISRDPAVVAQKTQSGLDWPNYMGKRKQVLSAMYRDTALLNFTKKPAFEIYKTEGRTTPTYSQYRYSNYAIKGQYFSTPDFYPRWPSNWRNWNGAWNGMQHIVESRNVELAVDDRLYAPFVSPGWSPIEESNLRPGDWLGLLKLLTVTGAEFIHTGFFNDAPSYTFPNPPPPYPANYAWQLAIPSYAQAAVSRAQDLLFAGNLHPGNTPASLDPPKAGSGYQFKTGNPLVPVMVRKHSTQARYLICGALPRVSNDKLNAPLSDTVMVVVDGDSLTFQIRRQGSMYIYDKSDTANKLFYQLDKWHQATHPSRWEEDLVIEAELIDSSSASIFLRTQVPAAASKGNYTGATSFIVMPQRSVVKYQVEPAVADEYVLYIRARHASGNSGSLLVKCGPTTVGANNIAGKTFKWYAVPLGALTSTLQDITFEARQGRIQVDRFIISSTSGLSAAQLNSK